MKKLLVLISIMLLVLFTGCNSGKSNISDAKNVAESYLKTLYRIEDYTKIADFDDSYKAALKIRDDLKPYVTERMYEDIYVNRVVTQPPELAVKFKGNTEVSNIVFNKESINEDSGVVTLNCTITIKWTSSEGKEVKSYDHSSIIQLKKEGGKYKVHSDSSPIPVFRID